ncbi:transcriptional regulator LldR [Acerihabitans arboris]|uniref:Transcriptional regulator LldR n=1 Tax=Acerihabitans arboris TaxID=2691583 RepID=A0A845SEA8_9GAMM|nr:transcriptional regulator LldR [Acerihabitans arboris]NDL61707.1 transcriptional regulator LldR [Acerihabitans arboris]
MTLHDIRLADQIVERLKRLITERGLAAGMRLPAERQLAAQLGVSRSSVREAIQKLSSQGLVVSRRGGGTYVQNDTHQWSEQRIVLPLKMLMADDPDYRYDVLEARLAIEASTAWHAALRATDTDKDRLRMCFDATLRVNDSDDPDLAAQSDVRFHLAIAEASHNLVLLQTMRGLFDLLQSSVMQSRRRMYQVPVIFAQLTEQHHELLQAILAGAQERARAAAIAHLACVDTTLRALHEDEARQARVTRLPHHDTDIMREQDK